MHVPDFASDGAIGVKTGWVAIRYLAGHREGPQLGPKALAARKGFPVSSQGTMSSTLDAVAPLTGI